MRKNFKKLLVLTLVFVMVLLPVQVSAKTIIPEINSSRLEEREIVPFVLSLHH